jgi:hypothetical protein
MKVVLLGFTGLFLRVMPVFSSFMPAGMLTGGLAGAVRLGYLAARNP